MDPRLKITVKVAAAMAAVLVAVKVAGLRVSAPERIAAGRVGVIPFETDGTQHALDFARAIGPAAAARLNEEAGVTAILIATRPSGFGTGAVNRQIRMNYQVGTLLTGRIQATGHRLEVTVVLIDTARDETIWERTIRSEETLGAILARITDEIASAIVAEL